MSTQDNKLFSVVEEDQVVMPVKTFELLNPGAFNFIHNYEGGFSLDHKQQDLAEFCSFLDEMEELYGDNG